jgi:AcrR family transcriptional regulator
MAGQGNADDGRPEEQESARRLGEVLLRTAGELGYHRTTVGYVLERSGEPRQRFDNLFSSKEDCFTAAYLRIAGNLTERMLVAGYSGATWCQGIGRALGELLDFVAAEPVLASALIVEVRAVKSATLAHDRILDRLAVAVDSARGAPGTRVSPPAAAGPLLVGGVEGYLREMLIREEADRAPKVLSDFVYLFVLTYFGEEAAFKAMDIVKNR